MQKWEEVEDVEALRETAAKLGVQNTATMSREQLIEALNSADVPDGGSGDGDQMRNDAEAAFGSDNAGS